MKIKAQMGLGRTALITGGSSGIGLAVAQILVHQGNNVYIVARRKELIEQAVTELKTQIISPDQRVIGIQADVANCEQVQGMANQVLAAGDIPDMVINSAGVVEPGYVQDLEFERFQWMMNINYHGTVHVIKAFLPEMMKRKSGYIINISSLGGLVGAPGYTGYSGSKFAVRGFSDALRWEMIPYQIGVSCVFPPDTETPQLEYDNQHKPPITRAATETSGKMTAEVVAKEIIAGARRGNKYISPGFETKVIFFLNSNFGAIPIEWIGQNILKRIAREEEKQK